MRPDRGVKDSHLAHSKKGQSTADTAVATSVTLLQRISVSGAISIQATPIRLFKNHQASLTKQTKLHPHSSNGFLTGCSKTEHVFENGSSNRVNMRRYETSTFNIHRIIQQTTQCRLQCWYMYTQCWGSRTISLSAQQRRPFMLSHKTTRDANKRILIRIPCHNSSHQDAVASIGFNSALIQELTVAPKLCYPEPCPPALRITFHSLQMMFYAICISNSGFFSLSVWLFKDISLSWEMQTKFYSETLKRRHFLYGQPTVWQSKFHQRKNLVLIIIRSCDGIRKCKILGRSRYARQLIENLMAANN